MPIQEDRTNLQKFLNEVEELLQGVLDRRAELLPQDLHDYFLNAWQQVRISFSRARQSLSNVVESRLEEIGLTGSQLALKLFGFRRLLPLLGPGVWRVRVLKRILNWANIILGSLGAVLPPVELAKEYKDAIERAIDEAEE